MDIIGTTEVVPFQNNGRNEVSSRESEDAERSCESGGGAPFDGNDGHFLRALPSQ
jgi:hypothetical protein